VIDLVMIYVAFTTLLNGFLFVSWKKRQRDSIVVTLLLFSTAAAGAAILGFVGTAVVTEYLM